MKTSKYLSKLSLFSIALMALFTACSAVNNDVESLTDEDIELATQIIGESVSDENSGMMSSVYDAMSSVSSDGIQYRDSNRRKADDDGRSGRGGERNYSYEYDSETGTHTLSYDRSVNRGDFSKSVSLLNTYIFTSPEGDFIVRPRANADSIESIDFTSNKNGSLVAPRRESSFARVDTFAITGLHGTSSTVTIDGTHHGEGTAQGVTRDSIEASRDYTIDIEFANIEINKDSVEANGNLEQGVTGILNYSIIVNRTFGERNDEKVMEGTIELSGDGTALLRFKKVSKIVRFSLKDGSREEG